MKMNKKFLCAAAIPFVAGSITIAQSHRPEPTPTPVKLVVTDNLPPAKPPISTRPIPSETPIMVKTSGEVESGPSNEAPIVVGNTPASSASRERTVNTVSSNTGSTAGRMLSFGEIKSKLAEAKRQMQSRPIATAISDGVYTTDFVRVAFHDWTTDELDYVVMTKEAFLSAKDVKQVNSQNGKSLTVRTIRGNGVNTPVVFTDERGNQHVPLIVQYPVERGGKYLETAYYISTHPGLVTPEVVNAGKYYIHNVIEIAREKLRAKGINIQPKIADVAERLATVEHVDHQRFRNENHQVIFNDIFTLFALNEGQTYRYSVSSAGAGGMVQMIPSTYRMVRSWHPNIPLKPDFVEGMRDHVNASQAMLLYMQRTWNDLIASPTVADAFHGGIATQEQLMAAGYNSNPARLAGYIKRGGAGWTNLIPRETQIYLQIYESLERHVPMKARTR